MKTQDSDPKADSNEVELSDAELAPIAAGEASDLLMVDTLELPTRLPNTNFTFRDPSVVRPLPPEAAGLSRGFPRPNVASGDGPSIVVTWSKSF